MYWEEYDILEPQVLVVGDSKAFHFLVDHEDNPASRTRSACGNAKSFHTYEASTKEDPEEMIDDGKRPCKQCVSSLTRFYDIEAHTCELCDRLNIMLDTSFVSEKIPYATGGEKEVWLCVNCRSRFGIDIE